MRLVQEDLVPIFFGAILIDIVFLVMNYARIVFVSERLTEWYTRFRVAAMALDVLIIGAVISLGVGLSRAAFDAPNIGHAILCTLALQIVHDALFYILFSATRRGFVYIFDVFKDYAAEVRYHAIWSDSLMVCGGLLAAEACVAASDHWQRMLLLGIIYIGLFALYSKPDPPSADPPPRQPRQHRQRHLPTETRR